jgi:hypothetical protein
VSIQAVRYVLEDSDVYGAARAILVCLAFHASADGEAWTDSQQIARECRIRKAHVSRGLKLLQQIGELELLVPGSPRRAARYRLRRFLEVANTGPGRAIVGAPTIPQGAYRGANGGGTSYENPRGKSEESSRDLSVPGQNKAPTRFPLIQGELKAVPGNTEGTYSGSHCIGGTELTPENTPMGTAAVPLRRDSVPTVSAGTGVVVTTVPGPPHPPRNGGASAPLVFKIYGELVGVWLGRHRRLPNPNGVLTGARADAWVRWYQNRGFEARLLPAPEVTGE